MRPGPRGAVDRPARARCGRQGADIAPAFPRTVQGPAGRPRLCDRDRRLPRRHQRSRLHSEGRAHLRREDRDPVGSREAKLSALGVISGIHKPDGIVGDLGGGSLELVDVRGHRVRGGVTLPLGSLALQDLAHKSLKRAERIVRNELSGVAALEIRPRPDLLCGRRHLARAGAHPHHPERLSAAR